MNPFWLLRLHLPSWLALRNALRKPGRDALIRWFLMPGAAIGLWVLIFLLFERVLGYFRSTEVVGDILVAKLLMMLNLLFLALLVYSAVVVALSTLFLARDLDLLLTLPIPLKSIFQRKVSETMWNSSWMFLLFALPVYAAFVRTYDAPVWFLPLFGSALLPFIMVPVAAGIAIIFLVARLFPARRSRDAMFVGSIIFFAAIYLVVRFMQPEKLVDPSSFKSAMGYIASLRTPSSPWLPSTWLSQFILYSLQGTWHEALFNLALLWSTGVASLILVSELAGWIYSGLLTKTQETRLPSGGKGSLWMGLEKWMPSRSPALRAIMAKDIRVFLRDPSQWSQIILIGALIIAYLYNFHVLPRERFPISQFALENIVSFLNLGLCGFVLSAMAARFVYPLVSLEGRAYWIMRTSPVRSGRLFLSKFILGIVPTALLGLVLTVASNLILGSTVFMHVLSVATTLACSLFIVALALCFGILYPRFDVENAARISMGFGGLMYMITAIVTIGAVISLEAWPVYIVYMAKYKDWTLSNWHWTGIAASFAVAAAILAAGTTVSLRIGLRRLATLEG